LCRRAGPGVVEERLAVVVQVHRGTSFTVTTLTPNHNYRVWLQAVDSNGGGPWSAANFSVASPLAAPAITGPVGTVPNPPTITWQPVSGALSYTLRIDDLTSGVSYFVWQTGLTATSFTANTLAAGHHYRVWLQGVDVYGGGPWSSLDFSTSP
jgi:Fibronectin type III domain